MKLKLIAILLLALSAILMVGFVSYFGLSNLMATIEATVKPDYREEKLQDLLYHLSEAENGVRIYTITRDPQYLRSFFSNNLQADSIIQYLRVNSIDNPYLFSAFDSIDQLISKKVNIQNRLVRLKQDQKRIDVYEEVLAKVQSLERKNAVFDSLENTIAETEKKLEREIIIKEQELILSENELTEEKQGLLKKIFGQGKKAERAQHAQQENVAIKEKELDTLLAVKDTLTNIIDTIRKENITSEVEQSLAEIKGKEEALNKELTIAELILTRRDKQFSNSIHQQVSKMQAYFDEKNASKATEASSFFSNITNLIKIIGTIFSVIFVVMAFIIFKDIKTNQRYRMQLERAKKKAERLAQAKNDFLSNMSHEIRTPMNAILGFAEQLSESPLDEKGKKQLSIIQNASQHLLSIINDILDFAKIEAGKIKLEKIPFYIPDNAQIVYDTLYKSALDKNLQFDLDISDQISEHHVKGDPVRFRQILFNLTGNAIKFTEEGFVKIIIDHDFRHIIIKVLDSGIGIEKENIHLIFKKFDQANQSTSKKYGGTGLGLAIVKKLVEMQRGLITVKSEKGQGTEFTVKLPYIPMDPSEEEKLHQTDDEKVFLSHLHNTRVLLVDDEEYNLLLLESILKKYSIPFVSVSNGSKAVEKFSKSQFDIAFVDLQMEDMDGIELTNVIRTQFNSDIPIIACTASANSETREKCLQAGMNHVLVKPIREKDFIQFIQKNIDQNQSQRKVTNDIPPEGSPTNTIHHENKLDEIYRLFQNDKNMAMSMAGIYHKNLLEINAFYKKEAFEALGKTRALAHKILPSTRHMGFESLAASLKELERQIEENGKSETINDLIKQIERESDDILRQIEEFIDSNNVNVN